MKINVFIEKENGVYKSIGTQDDFYSGQMLEDELVQSIDEEKMTREKILATRFLNFLGNRRLTIKKLSELPIEEQNRIKTEFIESLD